MKEICIKAAILYTSKSGIDTLSTFLVQTISSVVEYQSQGK